MSSNTPQSVQQAKQTQMRLLEKRHGCQEEWGEVTGVEGDEPPLTADIYGGQAIIAKYKSGGK